MGVSTPLTITSALEMCRAPQHSEPSSEKEKERRDNSGNVAPVGAFLESCTVIRWLRKTISVSEVTAVLRPVLI